MLKKTVSLLVIFFVVVFFAGCEKEARLDFSELILRTVRYHKDIDIDISEAFFSDGNWFIFLSSATEDDVILKAAEDENKYLVSVSISTVNNGIDGSAAEFIKLAEAVTEAFCDIGDVKAFLGNVGLYEENIIFSEERRVYEEGRYKLSFFNSSLGSSLMAELVY